jgi:hypothetical protein
MLWSALLTSGATRVMRASSAFYFAFATRMSRIWSVPRSSLQHSHNIAQHSHNIRTTSAWHSRVITAFDTRFWRVCCAVCRPFMHCSRLTLLARRKCAGPWARLARVTPVSTRSGPSYEFWLFGGACGASDKVELGNHTTKGHDYFKG